MGDLNYTTAELVGVIRRLIRPQTFLTRTFFPNVVRSDKKEVKVDVEKGKRRMAPFVSPRSQGRFVETHGVQTNTYEPAYIKDKRSYDPEDVIEFRELGEALTGSMSPAQRRDAWVARSLVDQQEMIDRRLEWMASQILQTGQVTITGDGFPGLVVDFQRDAGHTVTLGGGDVWALDGSTGTPLDDIEDWALTVQQATGSFPNLVIMDPDGAYRRFRANADVKEVLDTRRGSMATGELVAGRAEPELKGTYGSFQVWTYQDWYVDDAGVEQQLIPANTVLMGSAAIEGRQHYGAIRDARAGYVALPFFPKMWIEEDPSLEVLMAQSAPLLAPWRPDASFAATVA